MKISFDPAGLVNPEEMTQDEIQAENEARIRFNQQMNGIDPVPLIIDSRVNINV